MRTIKYGQERSSNVRWAFAEAQRLVACDRCEVERGEPCADYDGMPLKTVHVERLHAYHDKIGAEQYATRHTTPLAGRTE